MDLSATINLLGDTLGGRAARPGVGRPLRDGRGGARPRQGAIASAAATASRIEDDTWRQIEKLAAALHPGQGVVNT